jgi:hypothetical protein
MLHLLLLAAAPAQPISWEQFRAAARKCHMEYKHDHYRNRGSEGQYDPKSRSLTLKNNQSRDSFDCMMDWANKHRIMIITSND